MLHPFANVLDLLNVSGIEDVLPDALKFIGSEFFFTGLGLFQDEPGSQGLTPFTFDVEGFPFVV